MAKKTDITRNPPSWIEKGLFVVVLLIVVGIALPIFLKLNKTTFEYYECVGLQNELQACIDQWRADNTEKWLSQGKTETQIANMKITEAELIEYYGGELPECPYPINDKAVKLFKVNGSYVRCANHDKDATKKTLPGN